MYKKICNTFTMLVLVYLGFLYYLIKNDITKYLFILFSIYTLIYYFYICIYYKSLPTDEIIQTVDMNSTNEPDVIMIKVNNLSEINNNYNENCCICLECIDPIDSFRLNDCDYHLYHEECINLYIKNNFKKCPICNI